MYMKTLLLSLIVGPVTAWACPDLAGEYICQYKAFKKAVTVEQNMVNGATVFRIDGGGDIIADGQQHQTDSLHPILDNYASDYIYKATCQGANVAVEGTALMTSNQERGYVSATLTQQGTDLAIGMHLVTSTRTINATLNCIEL